MRIVIERNVWGESVVVLDDSDKAALALALHHMPSGHHDDSDQGRKIKAARDLLVRLGARE